MLQSMSFVLETLITGSGLTVNVVESVFVSTQTVSLMVTEYVVVCSGVAVGFAMPGLFNVFAGVQTKVSPPPALSCKELLLTQTPEEGLIENCPGFRTDSSSTESFVEQPCAEVTLTMYLVVLVAVAKGLGIPELFKTGCRTP